MRRRQHATSTTLVATGQPLAADDGRRHSKHSGRQGGGEEDLCNLTLATPAPPPAFVYPMLTQLEHEGRKWRRRQKAAAVWSSHCTSHNPQRRPPAPSSEEEGALDDLAVVAQSAPSLNEKEQEAAAQVRREAARIHKMESRIETIRSRVASLASEQARLAECDGVDSSFTLACRPLGRPQQGGRGGGREHPHYTQRREVGTLSPASAASLSGASRSGYSVRLGMQE